MTHVERFWSTPGDAPRLDGGYLADPHDRWIGNLSQNPDLLTTTDVASHRCAVLLGGAGSGKSTEIHARRPFLNDESVDEIRFDLGEYGTETRIVNDVLRCARLIAWRDTDEEELCLVLDSLDEAAKLIPNLASLLAAEIEAWPCERLWLRLACRSSRWPATLTHALKRNYESVTTVELTRLRRRDAQAIAAQFCEPAPFLAAVDEAGAAHLAAQPLSLSMLAEAYGTTGELAVNTSDMYSQWVRFLCDEPQQRRRDTGDGSVLSIDERVSVARRIAAATTFGGSPTISTGPVGLAGDAAHLDELTGSSEPSTHDQVNVNPAALRETSRSGLFSTRGENRLGWVHTTVADHLAAEWIHNNGLTKAQIRSLLVAPDGRSWPQTRLVAARLAAIDPDTHGWLVAEDPEAFRGDIDYPDDTLRAAIIEGLFLCAHRLTDPWSRFVGGLDHPLIAEQVRPKLDDIDPSVRQLAFDLARECRITELTDDLVRIALDETRPERDRTSAGYAIVRLNEGNTEPVGELAVLVSDPSRRGDDPNGQMEGVALLASWPHGVSTAEVFATIHEPPNSSFHGAYDAFLARFADAVSVDDLDVALRWLEQIVDQPVGHEIARLANAVLRVAGAHLDTTGTVDALTHIALSRINEHRPLCFEDFSDDVDVLNDDARRRIVREILTTTTVTDDVLFALADTATRLIQPHDLQWLADLHHDIRDEQRPAVAYLFDSLFDVGNRQHLDVLLAIPRTHPLFDEAVSARVDSVDLRSAQAQRAREQHERIRERQREREEANRDNLNDTILDLVTNSGPDGFWRATLLLATRPGHGQRGSEHGSDLTAMPRWATLTENDQAVIVEAAHRYLHSGSCSPDDWIDDPDTISHPAEAGYRALVLLHRCAHVSLDGLPPAVWKEWAPSIVDGSGRNNTTNWDTERHLLERADAVAHNELVDALLRIASASAAHDRFHHLRRVEDILWDDTVAEKYVELLDSAGARALPELVDSLAQRRVELVRSALLAWLADTAAPQRRQLAAPTLVIHDLAKSWDRLRDMFNQDHDLAVTAFAQRYHHNGVEIPEPTLASIYLWLHQTYPPQDDPDVEGVHPVGPREQLGDVRDNFAGELRDRGSQAAIDEINNLIDELPEETWLHRYLARAEALHREHQWEPVPIADLIALAANPRAALVRTDTDLVDLVIGGLARIQHRLNGTPPESHLLWDTRTGCPKSEDEVSDYLSRQLQDELDRRGVVLHREVQTRRMQPSGIGERTDLLVSAVAVDPHQNLSTIELPVEVKWAWNSDVPDSIRSQLADRYMRDIGARHGVYIVGWPDLDSWTQASTSRNRFARIKRQSIEAELDRLAIELRKEGRHVRVVHLDITYGRPTRS